MSTSPESAARRIERVYEIDGLLNRWPASRVGHVPVRPSHKRDPIASLVRLTWEGRSLWVPGAATRWNTEFVLVYVWPDETDRRSETMLWLHRGDVARALPARPSSALYDGPERFRPRP